VQEKVNKAVWLADSVLEGTLNQLRAELHKAREQHGGHGEVLDEKEKEAAALLERYNVAIPPTPATEKTMRPNRSNLPSMMIGGEVRPGCRRPRRSSSARKSSRSAWVT
jgi:alkanesulfonate monooxygenase SsuD/methylene tetrahydromethanopterin reductase-like flavin-dependent oxidoreductase (luciferase family)